MSAMTPDTDALSDTVVLLHGISQSRWNMGGVAWALRRRGFAVVNLSYPSLKQDLSALAAFVREQLARRGVWLQRGRVHFVTHSMGGLVLRRYLETFRDEIPFESMGRVVMIAPPNRGSEVASLLQAFPPYRWLFGPAGQQLTVQAREADETVPWYEAGVIAGTRSWPYPVAGRVIAGTNDGRVGVERARLPGMRDFITIPATHSLIPWAPATHRQVAAFLKTGAFVR